MRNELNDLYDYEGMKIYQNHNGFKFSVDSILLAEYVNVRKDDLNILDLCTGNAVVPLILSTKTNSKIDAFEIQSEISDLALKSTQYNNKNNQIHIYNDSVKNIDKYVKDKKYDIITCNPPYFKVSENSFTNLDKSKTISRHEVEITLEDILKISSKHLNTGGKLFMVHRVSRLDEIIIYANKYKLNVKSICLVKTKDDNIPTILLVKCVKDSKMGIKMDKEIVIDGLRTYQNIFEEEK